MYKIIKTKRLLDCYFKDNKLAHVYFLYKFEKSF